MKRLLSAALALLCAIGIPAFAQTPVTGNGAQINGATVTHGTINLWIADGNGQPVNYITAAGPQKAAGFTASVSGGIIGSGLTVQDLCLASPVTAGATLSYTAYLYNSDIQQGGAITGIKGICGTSAVSLNSYFAGTGAAPSVTGLLSGTTAQTPASCSAPAVYIDQTANVVKACVGGVFSSVAGGGGGGNAATISIGTVTQGTTPAASLTAGANNSYALNLVLPQGAAGTTPVLTIGSVTQGTASASLTAGANNSYALNLVLPQGTAGVTPTFTIGTVTQGSSAGATLTAGANNSYTLNLTLPSGGGSGSAAPSTYLFANFPTTGMTAGQIIYQSDWSNYTGTGTGPCLAGTGAPRGDGALRECRFVSTTAGVATYATADAYGAEKNTPYGIAGLNANTQVPVAQISTAFLSLDVTAAPYNASSAGATATTTSAAVAAGATALPVTSSATYAAGNGVYVAGAGASGANYIGTVSTVATGALTITPPIATGVASGAVVKHDETAAIQAATNALASTGGKVLFSCGQYNVNGPLTDTANSNATLTFPLTALGSVPSQGISWVGCNRPAGYGNTATTVIDTDQNTATFIGGKCPSGPFGGFCSSNVSFRDIHFQNTNLDPGVTMIDGTFFPGLRFFGRNFVRNSTDGHDPANTAGWAIKFPAISNDLDVGADELTIVGFYNWIEGGEHLHIADLNGSTGHYIFTADSRCALSNVPANANSIRVDYMHAQLSHWMLKGGSCPQTIVVGNMDGEVAYEGMVYDPNSELEGEVWGHVPYNDNRSPQTITNPILNGASNLRYHNLDTGICTGLNCPLVTSSTASLSNGLIAAWTMQDGSGTSNANSVDSSKGLTNANVTYATTTGFSGTVAQFNGSTSYARYSSASYLNFTGTSTWTACGWINPTSVAAQDRWIWGNLDASSSINGWGMEVGYASGNVTIWVAASSSAYSNVAFAAGLNAGTTYLVCGSYNGAQAASGMALSVNGVAVTSKTVVKDTLGTNAISSTGYFTVGARGDANSTAQGQFTGTEGRVHIWNRVLTAAEQSALYNAGSSGF